MAEKKLPAQSEKGAVSETRRKKKKKRTTAARLRDVRSTGKNAEENYLSSPVASCSQHRKKEGKRKKMLPAKVSKGAASEMRKVSKEDASDSDERCCQRIVAKILPGKLEKEKEKRNCQRNASKDAASERRSLLLPAKMNKKLPAKRVERCCR